MTIERTKREEPDPVNDSRSREDLPDSEHERHRVPSPDLQRIWSAAGVGTAQANTSASTPGSDVNTRWWVDYESVGATTTRLPDRYGDDQLIVDSLKIHPDGAIQSKELKGGNMARSGRVYLGNAPVPRGNGQVSAAVRYAKKRSFRVLVDLQPATAAQRTAARQEAIKLVSEQLEDRGDYAAIASEVQTMLSERYPSKALTVNIEPLARGQAAKSYTVDPAAYAVDADARFSVLIDPIGKQDTSRTHTQNVSSEEGAAESDQDAIRSTTEVSKGDEQARVTRLFESYQQSLSHNVQNIFKFMQREMDQKLDEHESSHSKTVEWTLGVGPAKEKKDSKDGDEPKSSPGVADKIKNGLKKGLKASGKWLYSKLKKRFPMLGALEIAGDLWDGISARGSVQRKGTETNSSKHTTGNPQTHETLKEVQELSTVADSLSAQIIEESTESVKQQIATRIGSEVSTTKKVDASKKKTINTSTSGTVVTHEVGQPRVVIKKLD